MSGKDIGEFLTNRFQPPVHTNYVYYFQIGRDCDETQRGNQVGWREDQGNDRGVDRRVVSYGFATGIPLGYVVPYGFAKGPPASRAGICHGHGYATFGTNCYMVFTLTGKLSNWLKMCNFHVV